MAHGRLLLIALLVELVRDGTEKQKEHAASILDGLAGSTDINENIVAAGGIPALMTLISYGTDAAKRSCASALMKLFD